MRVYRELNCISASARGCVVAIGNFDGVHLGHQKVLAETRVLADTSGAKSAALTFGPHPRRFFNPHLAPFSLASTQVKLDRMAHAGLAFTYIQHFDHAFAALSAEDFVAQVLVDQLAASHVVVGEDYRFGRARQGDVDLLRKLGVRYGFQVSPINPLRDGTGKVCSSSRVRAALAEGRISEVSSLLGQPWEVQGRAARLPDGAIHIPLGGHQRPCPGTYRVSASLDVGSHRRTCASVIETTAQLLPRDNSDGDAFLLDLEPSSFAGSNFRLRILDLVEAH